MQIFNKIIEFIPVILEKFFSLISGNSNRAVKESWYNISEDYPEKKSLEFSPEDIVEESVTAISFFSPVEMDVPYVTSPHGFRTLRDKRVWHSGTDFRAAHGSKCFAVEDCLIVETVGIKKGAPCRFAWKNGKWIDLHNGSITPRIVVKGKYTGNLYFYKHALLDDNLKIGDSISGDYELGVYGNYGYSMGSHCHFELWTPRSKDAKFSKAYRKQFKQNDPVTYMKKEFGLSFIGKTKKAA